MQRELNRGEAVLFQLLNQLRQRTRVEIMGADAEVKRNGHMFYSFALQFPANKAACVRKGTRRPIPGIQ
jgi:hypothetical protein